MRWESNSIPTPTRAPCAVLSPYRARGREQIWESAHRETDMEERRTRSWVHVGRARGAHLFGRDELWATGCGSIGRCCPTAALMTVGVLVGFGVPAPTQQKQIREHTVCALTPSRRAIAKRGRRAEGPGTLACLCRRRRLAGGGWDSCLRSRWLLGCRGRGARSGRRHVDRLLSVGHLSQCVGGQGGGQGGGRTRACGRRGRQQNLGHRRRSRPMHAHSWRGHHGCAPVLL